MKKTEITKSFKKATKQIETLKAKKKTPLYFELAPMLKNLKGWDIETTRNSVIFTHPKKGTILVHRWKDGIEVETPLYMGLNTHPKCAKLSFVFQNKFAKLISQNQK